MLQNTKHPCGSLGLGKYEIIPRKIARKRSGESIKNRSRFGKCYLENVVVMCYIMSNIWMKKIVMSYP